MEVSLAQLAWEVKGFWPYVPIKETSMETGQELQGVTPWISATVPGGVHHALWQAGLIPDPYFGMNSLQCEWVENRWWLYRTIFANTIIPVPQPGEHLTLVFDGLDYQAAIYLNGVQVGEHAGMYEPCRIELDQPLQPQNTLLVLFKGIPQEMGQIGYTSKTTTQKSRFNYKWDFSTRLVNIGFWQGVRLVITPSVALENLHVQSDYVAGVGQISVQATITDKRIDSTPLLAEITVSGPHDQQHQDVTTLRRLNCWQQSAVPAQILQKVCVPVVAEELSQTITVPDPAVWWPNGIGDQPLYMVTVRLLANGLQLTRQQLNVGIARIQLIPNSGAPVDALPYTWQVNGRKVYIKGMNITPIDHIYGDVTLPQYEIMIAQLVNAGVNLVRVWGGGLIETEDFYRLCDENGIMIWQEFIQSSSGVDNLPNTDPQFLRLLKANATASILRIRNHTALTVYSGGNELMVTHDHPVDTSNENIALLKQLVTTLDPVRAFLPTSASGPREYITETHGVSHDVHGSWRYRGNPDHYQLYGQSDNLFHSEFGMDGAVAVKSLKQFLPQDSLHPESVDDDLFWRHHGEWWGTYERDCQLFGAIEKQPSMLAHFVRASQLIQSEGLRYIIQADRRRAFCNSGVIVWQLNEPWPNASCTNLVDYYGETKSAYYQVKQCFGKLVAAIDYQRLDQRPGIRVRYPVYVMNSGDAQYLMVTASLVDLTGHVLKRTQRQVMIAANTTSSAFNFDIEVPDRAIYFISVQVADQPYRLYTFGTDQSAVYRSLITSRSHVDIDSVRIIGLPNGRQEATVVIKNSGKTVVPEAGVQLQGSQYWLLGDRNFVPLCPGESATLHFLLIPKQAGTFLNATITKQDQIKFEPIYLGQE